MTGSAGETAKLKAPCHSRCTTIKISSKVPDIALNPISGPAVVILFANDGTLCIFLYAFSLFITYKISATFNDFVQIDAAYSKNVSVSTNFFICLCLCGELNHTYMYLGFQGWSYLNASYNCQNYRRIVVTLSLLKVV